MADHTISGSIDVGTGGNVAKEPQYPGSPNVIPLRQHDGPASSLDEAYQAATQAVAPEDNPVSEEVPKSEESSSGGVSVGVAKVHGESVTPDTVSEKEVPFIAEVKRYTDQRGANVEHWIIVSGARPNGFTDFIGKAMMHVSGPMGDGHLSAPPEPSWLLTFPIPEAKTVQEAFDRFSSAAQEAGERERRRIAAEMQAQAGRIAVPGQGGVPPIDPRSLMGGSGGPSRRGPFHPPQGPSRRHR